MKAFVKELLRYERHRPPDLEGGVLGVTKAYYGCVEAQGRGTLHCHMMVWVEGGLNPKELEERLKDANDSSFGKRLVNFLDDTIWNFVPSDLRHFRQLDIRRLAMKNQYHTHSATCYKYCGDGPRQCRFDLDEANVIPESKIDVETGELTLRILNGLVNNYNPTILEAMRCNMDIQYIGSGEEAKAIIYYITDYITKSPLKAHVAYASLELAIKKLSASDDEASRDTLETTRRILQRTSFSILSNQELSAQQVASYLMDYGDHFTSHRFANVYWPSFERYVDRVYKLPVNVDEHAEGEQPSEEEFTLTNDEPILDDITSPPIEQPIDGLNDDEDINEFDEDEIRIGVHDDNIIELSNQLADYLYRGSSLDEMCLWEFVATTTKVSKTRRSNIDTSLITGDVKRYRSYGCILSMLGKN
ncbi:hypothetical protein PYCCODRAFT_1448041 [Trametes coccinea BRFM310]|uniref:Helitron helicase-like domain-containing protein n=1 Tax=Trametes coccinea (strain BRFM310) TaxID=1353009 RepID=A0A1Y2I8D0_TRAC3|nr:hypothetical protein PYCCODRAFT_1448041 [Trametes coccinea BRFM310]